MGRCIISVVYVTSDWHIGHKGITDNFRTNFVNQLDHDESIIYGARALVTKRDILYVLGDVAWGKGSIRQIQDAEFPCKMIMVRGNHDTLPTEDYLKVFDEIHGALRYKQYWMTHIPIHPTELYGKVNIHGHCHRGGPFEKQAGEHWDKYYNAVLELNDYLPINMQCLAQSLRERDDAPV